MRANLFYANLLLLFSLIFFSCKNQKEELQADAVPDYYPLQIGKYITYRLDSTVFVNLGRTEEIHSYQEKNVVDATITDNLGRPGYRIYRYLRDAAGVQPWQPAGTYTVTVLQNAAEVYDNNLRIVKLAAPVKEGTRWNGFRYLPADPYGDRYSFSNDDNPTDTAWDYTIRSVKENFTLNGKTINDVITVKSIDESLNVPVTDPRSYASKSFLLEKYAKGIGPVYHEMILWEYQPNISGGSPYTVGFGVKRSLIDYN